MPVGTKNSQNFDVQLSLWKHVKKRKEEEKETHAPVMTWRQSTEKQVDINDNNVSHVSFPYLASGEFSGEFMWTLFWECPIGSK
jgi:hypothetical protein